LIQTVGEETEHRLRGVGRPLHRPAPVLANCFRGQEAEAIEKVEFLDESA